MARFYTPPVDLATTLAPVTIGDWALPLVGGTAVNLMASEGRLWGLPLLLPAATWDQIFCEVTTGGSAGAVLRLGVYADSGAGRPKGLVLDAGTVDATGTGILTKSISLPLGAGRYWLAVVLQGAALTKPTVRTVDTAGGYGNRVIDAGGKFPLSSLSATQACAAVTSGVSGALPDPFNPGIQAGNFPIVGLRRSA